MTARYHTNNHDCPRRSNERARTRLPEEVRRFLKQPRVAVLATVRGDGTPASTACWYELQDGRILITMYATARRLPNIRSNPHVAMTFSAKIPISMSRFRAGDRDLGLTLNLEVMAPLSMRYTGEPGRSESHA